MPAEPLRIAGYDRVLVIDTHVVLETKPLTQLPWSDVSTGSILLLVPRQVATEIDAKKRDSRLGERARAFNRLLDAYFESRSPAPMITGQPSVDVAMMAHDRIDWDALDDLDRDDGDDRIVAQALNARVDDRSRLELLSHDLRPREAAITHGLKATKLPEAWLRPPEPSPHERRIAAMKEELDILRANQPELEAFIHSESTPLCRLKVVAATADEVTKVEREIRRRHPGPPRPSGSVFLADPFADTSLPGRHAAWARRLVQQDLPAMHHGAERLYAQHVLTITVKNVGAVAAANLSVEVRSGNATLHSKPYLVHIFGSPPPEPRHRFDQLANLHKLASVARTEPFTFYPDEEGPGPIVSWTCRDFRQDRTESFRVYMQIEVRTGDKAQVEVRLTCSNKNGDVTMQEILPVETVEIELGEVVDLDTRQLSRIPPAAQAIAAADARDDLTYMRNDGTLIE